MRLIISSSSERIKKDMKSIYEMNETEISQAISDIDMKALHEEYFSANQGEFVTVFTDGSFGRLGSSESYRDWRYVLGAIRVASYDDEGYADYDYAVDSNLIEDWRTTIEQTLSFRLENLQAYV